MPLDLALDLAHALDPVAFVQDRLKFEPDPWQASLLRSRARWILLNCCRQSGKSTTTAAVALHTAIYDPGLILLVSPSLRQSKELFAKVTGFLKDLEPAEVLEEDNKSCYALANAARVVSLPGDPVATPSPCGPILTRPAGLSGMPLASNTARPASAR